MTYYDQAFVKSIDTERARLQATNTAIRQLIQDHLNRGVMIDPDDLQQVLDRPTDNYRPKRAMP